jgi:hypothetical protein
LGNIENVLLNGTAHVPFDSGLFWKAGKERRL